MTTFPQVSGLIPQELEERLAEVLDGLPVLGCQLSPAAGGLQQVDVYLAAGQGGEAVAAARRLAVAGASGVRCSELADQDWLEAYRLQVKPFPVGRRWWLDPHPDRPTQAPDGRLRLAVEPRMAFGSGSHESTQLVLLELERMELRGRSVLDIGTGSGILALAADRLGASPVIGFDLDSDAIWVARQTAAEQERPTRARFFAGTVAALSAVRFDVVLCNMVPVHLLPLTGEIERHLAPGGTAVLSGIQGSERAGVVEHLAERGLEAFGGSGLGEWISLVVRAVRR